MATPSGAVGEQPGMTRQDSALELDESARSPSPTRRTTSPGSTPPLHPSNTNIKTYLQRQRWSIPPHALRVTVGRGCQVRPLQPKTHQLCIPLCWLAHRPKLFCAARTPDTGVSTPFTSNPASPDRNASRRYPSTPPLPPRGGAPALHRHIPNRVPLEGFHILNAVEGCSTSTRRQTPDQPVAKC